MSLTTRPLRPADTGAVLALMTAYDRRFFGEPVLALTDVEGWWRGPGFSFVDDTEAWVEADGSLVACSVLDSRGGIELALAEGWEDSGLDATLLSRAETAAADRGWSSVNRYVADADLDGTALLETRGYERHHTAWLLSLAEGATIVERPLDPGYAVRPMEERDAVAVHALVAEAFGEWQAVQRTYAEWRVALMDRPDVTWEACRVATCAGEPVGACVVIDPDPREPDVRQEAWVAQLAVRREHRHRGLAQQLLATTALAARERGVAHLGLSTDTRTGALGLYQRLGMTVRHTVHNYVLALGDAAGA